MLFTLVIAPYNFRGPLPSVFSSAHKKQSMAYFGSIVAQILGPLLILLMVAGVTDAAEEGEAVAVALVRVHLPLTGSADQALKTALRRTRDRGPEQRELELERLRLLFATEDKLLDLRWRLVLGLRDGSIRLDTPDLAEHLRYTVVNQIAIDQPKYSGFKTAVDREGRHVD